MFLPTTRKELSDLGWNQLDIILVTGDTYIDSPYTGVAVIGKTLVHRGFKVGIIAQPDTQSGRDITRLGEPALFWGITSGSVDSMVANYTASKKWRKRDDYTPGGENNRRPDRAVIAYTNLVKQWFKNTCPIVLGGIEASLRRVCHFDFWSNGIRRSILFDAKADYLVYGMGEKAVVQLASALKNRRDSGNPRSARQENNHPGAGIRGICYIARTPVPGYIELPSYTEVKENGQAFTESFHLFYHNNDPLTARGLVQKQDARYLVQTPPAHAATTEELDKVYDLGFEREVHPYYEQHGRVTAMDTIRFSIAAHRGCYGECHFCAIAVHEGRTVQWRSEISILREAKAMTRHPKFKGIISDAGGPTANMYGFECRKKQTHGVCLDRHCLFPNLCSQLKPDHLPLINLLGKIQGIRGVKKVFTSSGIRCDLVAADKKHGMDFLKTVVDRHVSGQLKLAPEHSDPSVLKLMGKPGTASLLWFKKQFDRLTQKSGKKQFLTYYFIAAHPGCTMEAMKHLKTFTRQELTIAPEQVQIFTPTPSTYSTLMYCTGTNPFTGESLFVEKDPRAKERQKACVAGTNTDRQLKKKRDPKSSSLPGHKNKRI
ncbi:MAG: YgiQ family radical SAM protein [Desulfobacteraceae bacterium]